MAHTFLGGKGSPRYGSTWEHPLGGSIPSWTQPKSINLTQFYLKPSCRPRVLFSTAAPQTFLSQSSPLPYRQQPAASPRCPRDDWKQMEQGTESPSFSICRQLLLAPRLLGRLEFSWIAPAPAAQPDPGVPPMPRSLVRHSRTSHSSPACSPLREEQAMD